MTHPHETVVRDPFAAHASADVARLRQLLSPDVVYHVPGDNPISGDYRGVDAVLGLWERQAAFLGERFVPQFHDLLAGDDHVVVLASARLEDPMQPLTWRMANVYHVADRRVTECWVGVVDGADDFDAFWSRPRADYQGKPDRSAGGQKPADETRSQAGQERSRTGEKG